MLRIKSSSLKNNKRKKIIKLISGFNSSNLFKQGLSKYKKSFYNKYVSRRLKKRFFRQFWIKHINSFLKKLQLQYSKLIMSFKIQKILLNRSVLYYLMKL